MKRIFILVAITLVAVGSLFAEENTLIDFSLLVADTDNGQNERTVMDFSNTAGASFNAEQKAVMKTSLALPNWDVVLASSSRTVTNTRLSYTQAAPSNQWGSVLGVRVHFPVEPFNSWALIKPPFEIPAYEPLEAGGSMISGTRFEEGYGVLKNVGAIKSIEVDAYGLNFPHSLSLILIDQDGNQKTVFMGYLNYDGWGKLRWDNPAYIQEVRNRELRIYPLYPDASPFIKFGGFQIQRDAAQPGGDFIAYFKAVNIVYDKALLDTARDIDDEGIWSIIQTRETDKARFEQSQFGQNQVLRYMDEQKQATEPFFTDPSRDETTTE